MTFTRTTRYGIATIEWDGYSATASVPGIAFGRGYHASIERAVAYAIARMH